MPTKKHLEQDSADGEKLSAKPYNYERAIGYALWLLGRRAYSEWEIKTRLERKKTNQENIQKVLFRLKELKLLDDADYARRLVATKKHNKGTLAIKQTLKKKGLLENVIEESLEQEVNENQQQQAALKLLEKNRWRLEKSEEAHAKRRKAYAFLARRGFTPDIVNHVLESFFDSTIQ